MSLTTAVGPPPSWPSRQQRTPRGTPAVVRFEHEGAAPIPGSPRRAECESVPLAWTRWRASSPGERAGRRTPCTATCRCRQCTETKTAICLRTACRRTSPPDADGALAHGAAAALPNGDSGFGPVDALQSAATPPRCRTCSWRCAPSAARIDGPIGCVRARCRSWMIEMLSESTSAVDVGSKRAPTSIWASASTGCSTRRASSCRRRWSAAGCRLRSKVLGLDLHVRDGELCFPRVGELDGGLWSRTPPMAALDDVSLVISPGE